MTLPTHSGYLASACWCDGLGFDAGGSAPCFPKRISASGGCPSI